ncbi:MAG: IclR family transcriptional regulator, partial [Burkholderiaceae bacterium]
LVSFDEETKTYRLGFGVLKLALPLLDESRSVVQVRPHLERIARLHHVSTALFVLKGERMVLTDFALSGADIQIHHRSGSRFPILFGSTGRWYALRSGKSVETLRQDYAQLRLERGQSFDDWYADCRRAHEAGVGVDRGWARAHVTTIAVPIFDAYGRPVLSITASDLKERFTDDRLAQVASALMEAARQVAGAARKDVSA